MNNRADGAYNGTEAIMYGVRSESGNTLRGMWETVAGASEAARRQSSKSDETWHVVQRLNVLASFRSGQEVGGATRSSLTIVGVILALSARLGTPDATAIFKGNPCVSWGTTRWPGPCVDCYVFADGTTRVDLYDDGRMPRFVIAECAFVAVEGHQFIGRTSLNSVEAVDAYDKGVWPVIVPLAVAVELAARAMVRS